MKIHSFLILRRAWLGALFGVLAACTTQSGPTYTLNAIGTPNQTAPTYRVECSGLFEGSKTCFRVAEETCKDQPVTLLESVDGIRAGANMKEPRELTFMCGKPAELKPAAQPQPQPVARAMPMPAPVPVPQRQLVLQGDANFAVDSAILTGEAKASLDRFIRGNDGVNFKRVTIIGYTDSKGARTHNQTLSKARAQAVLKYLRGNGVVAQEFVAEGAGQDDPVASNATTEGRALNRRVEVRVEAL